MKLSKQEIKDIAQKRYENSQMKKARLEIKNKIHPIKSAKNQANKYAEQTRKNYQNIVAPPKMTRKEAFHQGVHAFKSLPIQKKAWLYTWVFIIGVCMILGAIIFGF